VTDEQKASSMHLGAGAITYGWDGHGQQATLSVESSKKGNTIEDNCWYHYFV